MSGVPAATTGSGVTPAATGSEEIYTPPTQDEIAKILACYTVGPDDQEFIRSGDANSPVPTETYGKVIAQAALSGLSVLAFLLGPEGIVISAILTTGSGIAFGQSSQIDAAAMVKAIGDMVEQTLVNHDIDKRMWSVQTFVRWLDEHRTILETLERDVNATSHDYTHGTTLADNESTILNEILPEIRRHAASGVDGLFGGLSESHPTWDQPNVRLAGLFIYQWLFITMFYQCMIEARLASLKLRQKKHDAYVQYRTTYFNVLDSFHVAMDSRKKDAEATVERLRDWRRAQVTAPQQETQCLHPDGYYFTGYCFTDAYTGKIIGTQAEHTFEGWHFPEAETANRKAYDDYMTRLNSHIDRMLAGDAMLIDGWSKMYTAAQNIMDPLQPPAPLYLEDRTVEHPAATIAGAVAVCYEYEVINESGKSPKSAWTAWLTVADGKLPVIHISGDDFVGDVTYQIYHKIKKRDGLEGAEVLVGKVVNEKSVTWVEEEHKMIGGR